MKKNILSMVALTSGIFLSTSLFSNENNLLDRNDTKVTNSKSIELKKVLSDGNIKSSGFHYIENTFSKKKDVTILSIKELYTRIISSDWKGGIFRVSYIDNSDKVKKEEIVKFFYNDELIVKDIFNVNGSSMIKKLSLPLPNIKTAYDKDFKIKERILNLKSTHGKNMVIFSDAQCPHCKESMSKILDFARDNNMNIYFYDYLPENSPHVNSKFIAMCIYSAIKKFPEKSIEIINRTYKQDFPSDKVSLTKIVELFNKANPDTKIKKNMVNTLLLEEHFLKSADVSEVLRVKKTPTVFIDGKRL